MHPIRSASTKTRAFGIVALATLLALPAGADERRPGGDATVSKPINSSVFSHPSGNMRFERQLDFRIGDGIFRKLWASSPSSTTSSDGLGPLYNARSCQSCHLKDGRGRPPAEGETAVSMFLRLSIPPQNEADRQALESFVRTVTPEPTYGTQLQNFSVQGLLAEGRMDIAYSDVKVELAEGETVTLRKPSYRIADLNYGPLHPQTMISPRVTPQMIGLGLLEMIPEADILRHADPEDRDSDGIAGRPNQVWSHAHGKAMLGRFGWKAGAATVADQTAEAFAGDLGLSTPLLPQTSHGECTVAQRDCLNAPTGDDPDENIEVPRQMFDLTVFYARNLAVPARRKSGDPAVRRGQALFAAAGCAGCHVPSHRTATDAAHPEQSGQTIWPYTDLLLHDMGEGLADNRPEGHASGRHWRTAPLWGIGLTRIVSGHDFLLHDGRARGVLEAILWHGGEAQAARDRVAGMSSQERADLLAFINSL
ncbi:MAG: di-heme oxidoredictase family protein [Ferrovibrio sp.]|uniref:di-heme oxidoreductase family protein n=1 Tax=Ferrovibrio sp. TaxID=1917215 RepID=UPI00391B7C1D